MDRVRAYHALLKLTGDQGRDVDPPAIADACALAAERRLGPLVLYQLERHGLTGAIPEQDLEALRAQRRTAVARYQMWSIVLGDDLSRLGGTIDLLLLKGAALGHTVYPEPWLRSSGDVDILVHPTDADEGYRALKSMGYQLRTVRSEVHGPVAVKTLPNRDRLWIELHTRLSPRRLYPTLAEEAIWAELLNTIAWGRPFRCPSVGVSLLQTVIHLTRTLGDGCVGLKHIMDIRYLVTTPGYDAQRVDSMAVAARAQRLLALGLRLADLAPPTDDPAVESVVDRLPELLAGPHRRWRRLAWDLRAAGLLDRWDHRLARRALAVLRRTRVFPSTRDTDDE